MREDIAVECIYERVSQSYKHKRLHAKPFFATDTSPQYSMTPH